MEIESSKYRPGRAPSHQAWTWRESRRTRYLAVLDVLGLRPPPRKTVGGSGLMEEPFRYTGYNHALKTLRKMMYKAPRHLERHPDMTFVRMQLPTRALLHTLDTAIAACCTPCWLPANCSNTPYIRNAVHATATRRPLHQLSNKLAADHGRKGVLVGREQRWTN